MPLLHYFEGIDGRLNRGFDTGDLSLLPLQCQLKSVNFLLKFIFFSVYSIL